MKTKLLLIMVAFALVFNIKAKADGVRIHVIVICDTNDENIGKGCKSDQDRFVNQMGIIETALGCEEIDWTNVYSGSQCNNPNLKKAIQNLSCGSNDVIFFYYSGHGVHAASDNDWLPQMCLGYQSYDQDKFVPVKWVDEQLAQKGARLRIVMTDCCNNNKTWVTAKGLVESDGDVAVVDGINVANLKKLFYESKGSVVVTSSKRGQPSLGPESGGRFSVAFWDEIYRIEQGQGTADWNTLMEKTKERTLQSTDWKQEPVAKVNVNGHNSNPIPEPNPNPSPIVISVGEKELGEALKQIVNSNEPKLRRKSYATNTISKFFSSGAHVNLVGKNLTTNVGYKSVEEYLIELAFSKTVKGINIVKTHKGSDNKFDEITITEIR